GDENVGDKAITQGTLSAGANYIVAYTGNTLTITQATLHVAADHKTKTYGDSDPALTYVATSADFKNGDTSAILTGALSRTGDENVGDKAITQGTLSAGANYIVAYTGNTLTIGQRSVVATADNLAKTAGQPDPALTYSLNPGGLLSGDALVGSLGRDSGELAGAYAIRQGSLAAPSANYLLTFVGGTLTIVAASSAPPPSAFVFEPADFSGILSGPTPPGGNPPAAPGARCSGDDTDGCLLPYPANQAIPPFITFDTASL
ncbi:MAG TPA: MBG domain-containing protein, partial [Bauldia sp.]|nr:MBG domain-containing protein [Bauldia sp.]